MLSSNDIRNIKFSKSVGGYKQEEVDILLDKVETDYEQYERTVREFSDKVDALNAEIAEYKNSQNSIQNVLLSAQKLADQIIDEAKAKSEEILNGAEANISIITAREKELSNAFELKANERKAAIEAEINKMLADAKSKAEATEKAAAEAVAHQQLLFDKLKLEIAGFKSDITKKYKEHLEILQKLPDTVDVDPSKMAEMAAFDFENEDKMPQVIEDSADSKTAKEDGFEVEIPTDESEEN